MAKIIPWSLEGLLKVSHQGEAIQGTIEAKDEEYGVKLETSRRVKEGDFLYINAEIGMRRAGENMLAGEQVYALASSYSAGPSLRIMLANTLNERPSLFFDIVIDDGKISWDKNRGTLRLPQGEFSPRPLLRDVCRILNLRYEETELGIYLPKEQQPLLTPETVKDTYQRMKRTEYFPSLGCSSSRAGFMVSQFPATEGIHQTISIHFGQHYLRENPVTTEEMSLLQKTLLEYCPKLPRLDYTWRTETEKCLEGWDETSMSP